jgi:hypothetical protein
MTHAQQRIVTRQALDMLDELGRYVRLDLLRQKMLMQFPDKARPSVPASHRRPE